MRREGAPSQHVSLRNLFRPRRHTVVHTASTSRRPSRVRIITPRPQPFVETVSQTVVLCTNHVWSNGPQQIRDGQKSRPQSHPKNGVMFSPAVHSHTCLSHGETRLLSETRSSRMRHAMFEMRARTCKEPKRHEKEKCASEAL